MLSLYGLPPKEGRLNYLFFGFEGSGTQFNTNAIQMVVNHRSGVVTQDAGNGIFAVGGTIDAAAGAVPSIALVYNSIIGVAGAGYSVYLAGTGTGDIYVNSDVIPLVASAYDLGTAAEPFRVLYVDDIVGYTPAQPNFQTVSTQSITGNGTINATDGATALTTNATPNNLGMDDGTVAGQNKYVYIRSDGGSAIITPDTANGFATCTLNGDGDGATFMWDASAGWTCVGESGATFA